jgi:hypothetical protein
MTEVFALGREFFPVIGIVESRTDLIQEIWIIPLASQPH